MNARPILAACLVLLLVLAGAAVMGAAALAAETQVRFGPPMATGAFGEEVTFSTTFQSALAPERVELVRSVLDKIDPEQPGRIRSTRPAQP